MPKRLLDQLLNICILHVLVHIPLVHPHPHNKCYAYTTHVTMKESQLIQINILLFLNRTLDLTMLIVIYDYANLMLLRELYAYENV